MYIRYMNAPSRSMPKVRRQPRSLTAWATLGAFGLVFPGCLVYLVLVHTAFTTLAVAGFAFLVVVSGKREKRRLATLAETRCGDPLCEFARSFERHSVDTWAVRAVYEQVQELLRPSYTAFPLRAGDRLKDDLGIEMDDVEMDLALAVAERTGRSLEQTGSNPFFGKLSTVADLVRFFSSQPLVAPRERLK